jgi:hypothetical protein
MCRICDTHLYHIFFNLYFLGYVNRSDLIHNSKSCASSKRRTLPDSNNTPATPRRAITPNRCGFGGSSRASDGFVWDVEYLKRPLMVAGGSPPRFRTSLCSMKAVHSVLLLLSLAPFVAADDFPFNLDTGVDEQEKSDKLDANKLIYTTSGGVPSVHPIQSISQYLIVSRRVPAPFPVQRVGENGPLLLQDFHLVRFCPRWFAQWKRADRYPD